MNFNSFKRCNGKILFVFIWNCHINTYRHHTFPTNFSEIPFDILLRNTFRTFTYLHHLHTYEIGTKKCKLRLLATNSFFVVSHLYLYLLSTYLVRGPRKQKWRTTKNVSTQTLLFMFSKSINVSSNLSRYATHKPLMVKCKLLVRLLVLLMLIWTNLILWLRL